MNGNDPFASVRAPVVNRSEPIPEENDPFASVRSKPKEQKQEQIPENSFMNTTPIRVGKSILRGAGQGISNALETSARAYEEQSLPALLGMKPKASTERNIAETIRENVPEETQEPIPAMIGKGVEYAANPASAIGGPLGPFLAGAAGKGLELAGAPKWIQVAGELAATLLKPGSKKVYTEKSPEIQNAKNLMKANGLNEEEITLATNALKERKSLEQMAKMYKSTEKQVESTKASLEKGINETIAQSFPGFEKGIEEVEKRAVQLFDPVNKEAKQIVIMKPGKFTGKVDEIIDDIRTTLANTPDENSFIQMLETSKKNAVEGRTGNNFVNFYQTLNRIGKWVDPSKKESYMTAAKDAIKDTFRDNGSAGQKLAADFEKANAGWVKLHQAEKVSKILDKTFVDEAMDFSKLHKSLSQEKNYSAFKDAVGPEAAANLKLMSKIGSEVQRSAKAIEGSTGGKAFEFGKIAGNVMAVLSLNPKVIAPAIAGSAALETSRYLATQLLTNPKYQNLWIRMADFVKKGSTSQAAVIAKELEEMAKKDSKTNIQ